MKAKLDALKIRTLWRVIWALHHSGNLTDTNGVSTVGRSKLWDFNRNETTKRKDSCVEYLLTQNAEALEAAIAATVDGEPTEESNAAEDSLPEATDEAGAGSDELAALRKLLLGIMGNSVDTAAVQRIVAKALEAHHDKTAAAVAKGITDAVAAMPAKEIIVKTERATVKLEGRKHRQFEDLLIVMAARQSDNKPLNVWLAGAPGTGKTHAAHDVALAMGMKFHSNGALANKYELLGFLPVNGNADAPSLRTPFREAWEHGGVYLFDEVDGSIANVVVAFNSALANGLLAFPDGMIPRHPDCIIIAAANTHGQGATAKMIGRFKQDAAFLDRFVMLDWEIDEGLEREICGNLDWACHVQKVRAKAAVAGSDATITPRASMYGAALLAQGMAFEKVERMVLRKGLSAAQWDAIKVERAA